MGTPALRAGSLAIGAPSAPFILTSLRAFVTLFSLAAALPSAAQLSPSALLEASNPAGSWHTLGGTPHRSFLGSAPLPSLTAPTWLRTFDSAGLRIRWIAQVSPVVTQDLVLAPGIITPTAGQNQLRLFALRRSSGAIAWSAALPITSTALGLESQSTPAIDSITSSIVIAHGSTLSCFALSDGALRWQTALGRLVVNASPVIASDVPGARRAFITTFDAAAGNAGELLCINLDAFDAVRNPYQPGVILWRANIGGSSGNSPALVSQALGGAGLVYVASAGSYGQSPAVPGSIFAFNARATSLPAPTWIAPNTIAEGFYGGLSMNIESSASPRPLIAAASYAFSGGLQSSNIIQLDAGSGVILACSASNRTSATPAWLPGGRILLSTGLASASVSDTAPALELFAQSTQWSLPCSLAGQLWNSALSTWTDSNADSLLTPGEYLALGHYIHHPAVSVFAGRTLACVGTAPTGDRVSPPTQLRIIDVDALPNSPTFTTAIAGAAVGGSPSIAGLNLYSSGADGLASFGPPPSNLDVDGSAAINVNDLHAWEASQGSRDVDGSGTITPADRQTLLLALRSRERFALTHYAITRSGGAP